MKLLLIVTVVGIAGVVADRLENTYLPPISANTAGGNGGFLTPPHDHHQQGSAFTSYAAPPSGPVPTRFYNTPNNAGRMGGGVSGTTGAPVATLRFNNDNSGDGAYRFEYETENRISHEEIGQSKSLGTGQESKVVQGSYSFTAPDGVTYTVNYIADENGFRASGDHLPTPPPVQNPPGGGGSNAGGSARSQFSDTITATFGDSLLSKQYLPPHPVQSRNGYRY